MVEGNAFGGLVVARPVAVVAIASVHANVETIRVVYHFVVGHRVSTHCLPKPRHNVAGYIGRYVAGCLAIVWVAYGR